MSFCACFLGSMGQRSSDSRKNGANRIYNRETQRLDKGEKVKEEMVFHPYVFAYKNVVGYTNLHIHKSKSQKIWWEAYGTASFSGYLLTLDHKIFLIKDMTKKNTIYIQGCIC